jgi:hypothetical protein
MGGKCAQLVYLLIEVTTMCTLGTPDALPNEQR